MFFRLDNLFGQYEHFINPVVIVIAISPNINFAYHVYDVQPSIAHGFFNPLIKFRALYMEERQISAFFITTALCDKN